MFDTTEFNCKFYDDYQLEIIEQIKDHIKLGYETDEDLYKIKKIFIEENKEKYGKEYWNRNW